MLTISKPLNAGQAQSYHAKEFTAAEQSYWAKDAAVGAWQGQLAEKYGLTGAVTDEHFTRMSQGQHPETVAQLVKHRSSHEYTTERGRGVKSVEHRAGWDATFSAPKSVSLAALVGGDERVREAHREAVTVALGELERYAHARLGGNTAAEATGKLAIAKFEHDTARPVDGYAAPQLHTHAVVFNVTEKADGSTRALQEKAIFDTQGYATAVYQSELTSRLRSLGYELETGKSGAPEIKGISREYIEASSPRSQQIQEAMEKQGVRGPEAAEIAAHGTRESKQRGSPEAVLAAHKALAAQYGNQADRVVAEARERAHEAAMAPQGLVLRVQEAISYARDKGFEREAVTDERMLMRDALRYGMGELRHSDVRPAFEQRLAAGEFTQLDGPMWKHASARQITTPETIAHEKQAVSFARQGAGAQEPLLAKDRAAAWVASRPLLNEGQRNAVREVLTSPDRVTGLRGLAGTGKTTTLETIRDAAEHRGFSVEGFAPTGKAASQLREAGISAMTLQKFLAEGGRERQQADPENRKLYILDESSLASTRQVRSFLEKIAPQDRVLLVGDTRQHEAVDAGRPFKQLQDAGMRTASLDKIVRQRDPALRAAVEQLSRSETRQGVAMLQDQGRVSEVTDKATRFEKIAKAYAAEPLGTVVVSPDNASRRAINQAVRDELQVLGLVGSRNTTLTTLAPKNSMTGADRKVAGQYEAGDVLFYQRGSKGVGVKRGEYATVEAVDRAANRLTVRTQDGQQATYDPRRLSGVSAYKQTDREFAQGDRIQFTAPVKDIAVNNRDMATILGIQGHRVMARLDGKDSRIVQFDADHMRHFDHGYAVTSHSSQGITVDRVLVNADTKLNPALISNRFAYVSVSRAREDAQVFTNDAGQLAQKLSKNVSKSTAVEFAPTQRRVDQETAMGLGL